MTPDTATNVATTTLPGWQYGLLGIAAFTFAAVIVYLFKFYNKRERRWDDERKAFEEERRLWARKEEKWEADEEKREKDLEAAQLRLRSEYEEKHRALVVQYAQAVKEERDANRLHEDGVRRELGEMMEAVSDKAAESSQALVDLLQKFYDRFVGPRSRAHH